MTSISKKIRSAFSAEKFVVAILLLLGFLLRLRQYLTGRSLWLDEVMLALNIVNRDFATLLRPLDYNQGAPIGFLHTQKMSVLIFGNNEFALRLFPFLAGTASLVLFYWLLRSLEISPVGELSALALFTVSPNLISYSVESKQYIVDVFLIIVVLLSAFPLFNAKAKTKDFSLLGGIGVLVLWFSHPALFVLAGIGVVVSVQAIIRREWTSLLSMLGVGFVWLVNVALLYFVSLQYLSQNNFLLTFWEAGFMPMPPWSNWGWFGGIFIDTVQHPIGTGLPFWLIALLLVIGWVGIWRKHRQFSLVWLAIFLFTLLASGMRLYPFQGRMTLFFTPLILLNIGFCNYVVWDKLKGQPTLAWIAVVALSGFILYRPVTESSENFIKPKYAEHIRPTLDFLESSWQADDRLYISYWTKPAFLYYAARYHLDQVPFEMGNVPDYADPAQLLQRIDPLKGNHRVWILMSHVYERGKFNERKYLLSFLNKIGEKKHEFRLTGTSVWLYLYDLTP